jgi:hypothetical protein
LPLGLVYARPLYPGVYRAEPGFGIVKLGMMCVYPCLNMMTIVCCSIPKVGVEPSMVVQLWKWFTDWTEGFGIEVPPADAPLMCGLV